MSVNTVKNDQAMYAEYLQQMIEGIDVTKNSKWSEETRDISTNIRDALYGRIRRLDNDKTCDDNFLDFCNGVKSLLAIYNFGNLDSEELLVARNAAEAEIAACKKRREDDKALIKSCIARILKHINVYGYDITPNLDRTACQEIFGEDENRVVPITISATTVFTTLVYFRRAIKRIKLFTKNELVSDGIDLNQLTVQTISDIMYLFYSFAYDSSSKDKFVGWGVTLDRKFTKAVTLSDTYAVVDAISRYADAFTKEGDKNDSEFTKAVDDYAVSKGRFSSLTDRCLKSTYKTSFNVYNRTKSVYGKSVFYSDCVREGESIKYNYSKTSYEQIASSSRSSALFNPLYVAMITMYGYTDKEVVIRKFMDNSDLANIYYEKYEKNCAEGEISLSQYAKTLSGYDGDFSIEKDLLLTKQDPTSKNYSVSTERIKDEDSALGEKTTTWRSYYNVARVFQKYLETQHPEELMKISDYRDYLNATKDAIDQVQIMYRDFDNHQRLGVVDTDYAMFTAMDVDVPGEELGSIAKLNKANIAVNNLRPMLLSSKIMIVNALTKYPQADMVELYSAIKEARFSTVKRRKNAPPERMREWVWNEDAPDMNSTARHCEAIMYDFFDYYENYEIGFKSMQAFRKDIGEIVKSRAVNHSDVSIGTEEEIKQEGQKLGDFQYFILELTRQNVELVKGEYNNKIRGKDKEIADLEAAAKKIEEQAQNHLEELEKKHQEEIDAIKKTYQEKLDAFQDSYMMGEAVKGWINKGVEEYLSKNLSMAIINTLNGNRKSVNFDLEKILEAGNEIVDANLPMVGDIWKAILEDCNEDPDKFSEKIAEYNQMFRKAIDMKQILGAASNGILENDFYKKLSRKDEPIKKRNEEISTAYAKQKFDGIVPKNDTDVVNDTNTNNN